MTIARIAAEAGVSTDFIYKQAATRVARDYGTQFALRGPVVIVGKSSHGDTIVAISLSTDQIDTIRRRMG
ncbi:hypothetical protein AB0F17_55550 [Nonomuraea sp. NPDC026600]|uniref:hypothetical protein n=1 Tax=Nonomuraea sp. NPDC026600 TaxID=3155363 RepID=UPI0033C9EE3A